MLIKMYNKVLLLPSNGTLETLVGIIGCSNTMQKNAKYQVIQYIRCVAIVTV